MSSFLDVLLGFYTTTTSPLPLNFFEILIDINQNGISGEPFRPSQELGEPKLVGGILLCQAWFRTMLKGEIYIQATSFLLAVPHAQSCCNSLARPSLHEAKPKAVKWRNWACASNDLPTSCLQTRPAFNKARGSDLECSQESANLDRRDWMDTAITYCPATAAAVNHAITRSCGTCRGRRAPN
jgi:hypothetical protein